MMNWQGYPFEYPVFPFNGILYTAIRGCYKGPRGARMQPLKGGENELEWIAASSLVYSDVQSQASSWSSCFEQGTLHDSIFLGTQRPPVPHSQAKRGSRDSRTGGVQSKFYSDPAELFRVRRSP